MLEKFRNPILNISETYLNLTGKEYRILDTRSKPQIIIDCSVLLSQESILNNRLKIQDLLVEEPGFKNVKNKHLGMSPF